MTGADDQRMGAGAPEIDDPLFRLEPEALRCPHLSFARLREDAPVGWLPQMGCYVVSRYDDVTAVLRDPELWSSRQVTGPRSVTGMADMVAGDDSYPDDVRAMARRRVEIAGSPILIYADPPLHSRQRKLVNRAFTPRRVREMEEPIRDLCHRLIDRWEGRDVIELHRDFSILLPMTVISEALGVPDDMSDDFARWSDAFVAGTGNPNLDRDQTIALLTAVDEFYDYFTAEMADRRRQPRDDMITVLVEARVDDAEPLTDHEILQALSQILVAGNETTAKLITMSALRCATDPALDRQLRQDPSLLPAFLEEMLRLETPAQGLFRTSNRATTLGGVDIAAGSLVFLSYAAANRDEGLCPHGDDLELDRSLDTPHLAFGLGEHFCLGASLARAEARIGFETLFHRVERFELADPADAGNFEPNFAIRGVRKLDLRIAAR